MCSSDLLLREGLEAILLLAAIIAFVSKTGRRDALPWVHAGWIAAFVLGGLTWVVATWFIGISGANREMTEGITALVAAVMLLYVGYWLHGHSQAKAWSRFLKEKVDSALERKTLWALASVSFLAVYREYTQAKDVTWQRIYLETMEQVLRNANKVIIDQGDAGNGVVPYLPLPAVAAPTPPRAQGG